MFSLGYKSASRGGTSVGNWLTLYVAATVVGISALLGYVAFSNVRSLGTQFQSVYRDIFLSFHQADKVDDLLDTLQIDAVRLLDDAGGPSSAQWEDFRRRQNELKQAISEYRADSIAQNPKLQNLLKKHNALEVQRARELEALQQIGRSFPHLEAALRNFTAVLKQGDRGQAAAILRADAGPGFERLEAAATDLRDVQFKSGEFASLETQAVITSTRNQIILALMIVLVIGFAVLAAVMRSIARPLRRLTQGIERVAEGDLSWRIEEQGHNEFSRMASSFNLMTAELKRSYDSLAANEQRLTEAQQMANLGSWDWDIAQNKVVWSEQLYRIFGLQPYEFGGTYEAYLQHVHPDDRDFVSTWIEQALREKRCDSYDCRIIQQDGSERIIQASAVVVEDESGTPVRMSGVAQDVTERKHMEMELQHTRDAALESARIKSQFLANMSHEIRTPMNGVIGMTEILLGTDLNERQREFARTIHDNAEILIGIINDILDLSKIEAGKLEISAVDFDLRALTERTVELLAQRAEAKGIELALLLDSDVPAFVRGDAGRLQQVLTNLVSNAVKFTSVGDVAVYCRKEKETARHVTLRFTVNDTGVGVPPEAKKYLFQAFSQADGSTTRKYGGTGLGLAISQQMVRLMGGEIGYESEPGHGSSFWFTVRLKKATGAFETPGTASEISLKRRRVLIVDDNATNRKILMHQTACLGMSPAEADNAASALELLRKACSERDAFDVALLDFDMPHMTGIELAKAIKSDLKLAGTRLILMPSFTGHEGLGDLYEGLLDAYLRKPVRQSQLRDCLTGVMGRSAPAPSDALKPSPSEGRSESGTESGHHSVISSGARVLVAEDNSVNQTVVSLQLQKLGFFADVVANGREAIGRIAGTPYDIVLMDCQMPEMDGFEATREIRAQEGTSRHTVIVAMTANSMEGDREKCLAAGMDDYLAKPVRLDDLRQVLTRWAESVAVPETLGVPVERIN